MFLQDSLSDFGVDFFFFFCISTLNILIHYLLAFKISDEKLLIFLLVIPHMWPVASFLLLSGLSNFGKFIMYLDVGLTEFNLVGGYWVYWMFLFMFLPSLQWFSYILLSLLFLGLWQCIWCSICWCPTGSLGYFPFFFSFYSSDSKCYCLIFKFTNPFLFFFFFFPLAQIFMWIPLVNFPFQLLYLWALEFLFGYFLVFCLLLIFLLFMHHFLDLLTMFLCSFKVCKIIIFKSLPSRYATKSFSETVSIDIFFISSGQYFFVFCMLCDLLLLLKNGHLNLIMC